jgi:hypothetical protein
MSNFPHHQGHHHETRPKIPIDTNTEENSPVRIGKELMRNLRRWCVHKKPYIHLQDITREAACVPKEGLLREINAARMEGVGNALCRAAEEGRDLKYPVKREGTWNSTSCEIWIWIRLFHSPFSTSSQITTENKSTR